MRVSVANTTEFEIAGSVDALVFCKPCQNIPRVGVGEQNEERGSITSTPVQEASVCLGV